MKKPRILVPIESSTASDKAVELALCMADMRGYAVYLFMIGSKLVYGRLAGEGLKRGIDHAMEEMDDILSQALVRISHQRDLDLEKIGVIHKRFGVGDIQNEVLKMADNITSHIVIMGVTCPGDPDYEKGRFLFDTKVAANVVKNAPCSVFAVKAVAQDFELL